MIIALVEKLNEDKNLVNSYSFFHPDTGDKIDAETQCKEETITVIKDVFSKLKDLNDIELRCLLYLTEQNIDIFNLSGTFYNDICFHFESPNGKDVPLRDRIQAFYPNITLCDAGCIYKGFNLTTMEIICECKFIDIMSNELIEENVFLKDTIGELKNILGWTNLEVLKCFKNVFKAKFIIKNIGGFIILGIIISEIVCTLIFYLYNYNEVSSYLFYFTEYFSSLIKNKKNTEKDNNTFVDNKLNVNSPPPKKKEIEKNKKINSIKFNENKNDRKPLKKTDFDESNKSNIHYSKSDKMLDSNNSILKKKSEKETDILGEAEKNTNENSEEILSFAKKIEENYGIDMDEYLKTEPDEMEYDDAIKYDKRSFCEFFCDRFKEKQIIIDTFFNKEYLKPMTIKIILLLLYIDLHFVINGFFISEYYISELFHSVEKETFFSFFPRSIGRAFYTFMVSKFMLI